MPKADSPSGFKPLKETALFSPLKLGPLSLEHRIVQAPLTRMRATKEEDGVFVPKELHMEYYSQRASKGGLQLTEATDIAKYVSRTQAVEANALTCSRPADTQVYRVYSPKLKSPAGRRSQTQSMQRVDTSSASYGTLAVLVHPPSGRERQLSARAMYQWRVVG
jgi:hypothetical protein